MGDVEVIPLVGGGLGKCGLSGAARLLARAGRIDISVLDDSPQDWADTTGDSLGAGA